MSKRRAKETKSAAASGASRTKETLPDAADLGTVDARNATLVPTLACTFLSLSRKKHHHLHLMIRRNPDVMKLKEVVFVENNGLGLVKLLQLLKQVGPDRLLEMRPLGPLGIQVNDFPAEYRVTAKKRNIGYRERKRLIRQLGVT